MNRYFEWHAEISYKLMLAKDSGRILKFKDSYGLPIDEAMLSGGKSSDIPPDMIELYRMFNGFEFNWVADDKGKTGGNMHFLKMEQVLQNWEGSLFDDSDIAQNSLIKYFHPFDLITPEAQCGIMIGLEYKDEEIYFNMSPYPNTEGLDINFNGYLEIAKESCAYYYWPMVLIDIRKSEEGHHSKMFKQNMPLIFPDFNWDKFVEKYQSLRLSK